MKLITAHEILIGASVVFLSSGWELAVFRPMS